MSIIDIYLRRAEDLLGEISGDRSVGDEDFVELCEEIADEFRTAARAKKEELGR